MRQWQNINREIMLLKHFFFLCLWKDFALVITIVMSTLITKVFFFKVLASSVLGSC